MASNSDKPLRCDTCRFWVIGEQWGGAEGQEKTPADDRMGTCHRYAPSPTKGDFEYRVLNALVLIAPENEQLEENWEQCIEANHPLWPSTYGIDWCGEYCPLGQS
jgi:hypothetical protein